MLWACVYTGIGYDASMKSKLITFKAEPEDVERWKAALDIDGRSLSKICRAALDRIAANVEKKVGGK